MLSTVRRYLFAHDFVNPPNENTSCDVTLRLVNSRSRINLTKESAGLQTRYSLLILDPSSLGLSSSEQNAIDLFTENLVLAANLLLHRTALSTLGGDLAQSQIEFKQPKHRVVIEDRPEEKKISFTEVVIATATVHIRIGFTEEIDEDRLVFNLELINKVSVDKFSEDTKVELVNLKKALTEYKNAMLVFDRLVIFKHLFNSLELATNWNGVNRKGQDLDYEVARIASFPKSEICNWRKFYNRTKHVDKTPKDITTFIAGMGNLSNLLMPLRLVVETVIIDRLKNL